MNWVTPATITRVLTAPQRVGPCRWSSNAMTCSVERCGQTAKQRCEETLGTVRGSRARTACESVVNGAKGVHCAFVPRCTGNDPVIEAEDFSSLAERDRLLHRMSGPEDVGYGRANITRTLRRRW